MLPPPLPPPLYSHLPPPTRSDADGFSVPPPLPWKRGANNSAADWGAAAARGGVPPPPQPPPQKKPPPIDSIGCPVPHPSASPPHRYFWEKKPYFGGKTGTSGRKPHFLGKTRYFWKKKPRLRGKTGISGRKSHTLGGKQVFLGQNPSPGPFAHARSRVPRLRPRACAVEPCQPGAPPRMREAAVPFLPPPAVPCRHFRISRRMRYFSFSNSFSFHNSNFSLFLLCFLLLFFLYIFPPFFFSFFIFVSLFSFPLFFFFPLRFCLP